MYTSYFFATWHLLSGFCTSSSPLFSSEPEVANSYSASFVTFCCQESMASSSLTGVTSEGRRSCPRHWLATEEALVGTGVRGAVVADGVAVVFQMKQGA